jgi:hypothetical protein
MGMRRQMDWEGWGSKGQQGQVREARVLKPRLKPRLSASILAWLLWWSASMDRERSAIALSREWSKIQSFKMGHGVRGNTGHKSFARRRLREVGY